MPLGRSKKDKLKGAHQLLLYADGVNLLWENIKL
jgi:hypothetical protein